MSATVRRHAVDVGPRSPARPGLALLLAMLAIPGSTIAWDLPAGGLWIGLPLGVAAIALALRARREAGPSKTTTAAIAIAALMLGQMAVWTAASVAGAAAPTRVAYPVNVTTPIPELGAVCGFDVTLTITGTFKGIVFTDQRTGAIVREIDTQPATRFVWSSPTTGKSFSTPWATVYFYEYRAGTDPGAPVVVSASGLDFRTKGFSASAGRVVFGDAIMVFVTPDGVPIVDFGSPTARTGHTVDPELNDAAICAALAP